MGKIQPVVAEIFHFIYFNVVFNWRSSSFQSSASACLIFVSYWFVLSCLNCLRTRIFKTTSCNLLNGNELHDMHDLPYHHLTESSKVLLDEIWLPNSDYWQNKLVHQYVTNLIHALFYLWCNWYGKTWAKCFFYQFLKVFSSSQKLFTPSICLFNRTQLG